MRLDYGYQRNGTRGFVQALSVTRPPADAKLLAYTAGRIRQKVQSSEFTAVTDVALLAENERHRFVQDHEGQLGRLFDGFPARIALQSVNEPGSLAQIAQVIAEHDGNIDNISMHRRSPDFTELTIDLEVYDLKHLSAIIAQLRAKAVVARVERVNG